MTTGYAGTATMAVTLFTNLATTTMIRQILSVPGSSWRMAQPEPTTSMGTALAQCICMTKRSIQLQPRRTNPRLFSTLKWSYRYDIPGWHWITLHCWPKLRHYYVDFFSFLPIDRRPMDGTMRKCTLAWLSTHPKAMHYPHDHLPCFEKCKYIFDWLLWDLACKPEQHCHSK